MARKVRHRSALATRNHQRIQLGCQVLGLPDLAHTGAEPAKHYLVLVEATLEGEHADERRVALRLLDGDAQVGRQRDRVGHRARP